MRNIAAVFVILVVCSQSVMGICFDYNQAIWYTAPNVGMSCNQVCANYGGFNVEGSKHTGNAVGKHFYPSKADHSNWQSVECSSTDNNVNWGANGATPNGDWSHSACYVNCACLNSDGCGECYGKADGKQHSFKNCILYVLYN
jgi:hypothetical protein